MTHLPLHTPTGWHLQKPPICCYLTNRDGELFSAQQEPPSHSPSNYCLFFSSSSVCCYIFPDIVRLSSTWSTFLSFFLELFQKIFQSQCEMTLTGPAVAAYIVQFRISLLFIQVTGRGTKMLWQSLGTMRITLTLVVCFRCLIRCSENSFIKPKYTGYKLCKYNHKSLNMFSCCDSGIYIINLQQSKVDYGQALQESLVQNHPCRCFKRAIYSANNEAREMFSGYNLKSV